MKLIIQIPCYNEEKTLPLTFIDLPKTIKGIDNIETLIIDDGSIDRTVEIAQALGINHIVKFKRNKGLARAFEAGINKCLELGADIIVNTDGDNQYFGGDIARLVEPIINNQADVVVGDRQTDNVEYFSWFKKKLQKLGSSLVRKVSDTDIQDSVSGFRAYSRETAMQINILTDFSYTIENLIQLGYLKAKILSVPIRTNEKTRKSRLFKNIPDFISRQVFTLLRVYTGYKSIKVFSVLGVVIMLPGVIGFIRFLYFYFNSNGDGHIQSLIFSTVLLNVGFLVVIFGVIADLISTNRRLLERIMKFTKEIKWNMEKK